MYHFPSFFQYPCSFKFLYYKSQANYSDYKQNIAASNQKMDPQQDNQSEKKLGDLRKQITPGNDDENSFEELYSDEEDKELENNQYKSLPTKSMKNNQMEQEELWDDTPDREHGQSMVLEALPSQLAEQKGIQGEKQKQQQNKEGNQNQWDMQGNEKKQEQKQRQSTRGRQGRENTKKQRASQQQKSELKSVSTPYDSKFVYAAFYLLRQELTEIAKNYKSFVRFNPYVSSKIIKVCAQDQKTCEQVAGKIDDCINDVQVIQMGKFEAESGIQLSYKYLQQLLKQKITIFKDNTQNYKSTSYYICGKVSNKVLYQKLSQIKNTHFSWVHMFRFQNTRSYRAILRKIFQTPEIHEFAMEKFKAREIQVGYLRKDFPFPSKESKRGVLVLLTYHRQKKITIHQQIQQTLSTFIKETFSVFCFIFKRKKQSFVNRYTPKVDKVIMFFIAQKATNYQTNYLYVIVKNDDFAEMRQKIINEIQNMKLVIRGRRFFKNICPLKETFGNLSKYKEYSFPRNYPYSWSIIAKKDSQFDWKEQFKI